MSRSLPGADTMGVSISLTADAVLLRDADPQPAEALALVFDLHDLDPADLRGRRDVRTAVGLLVEADDVYDPDLLDLGRDQVGRRADDVRDREGVVAGQDP